MDKILALNNIYINTINSIYNNATIKTRHRKLSWNEAMYYRFKYSQIRITKQEIASKIAYKNDKTIRPHHSTFERKEKHITLQIYKSLYQQICDLDQPSKNSIIAIDGTYSNTNINKEKGTLQSSLTMGYFDVTNNTPVDLSFIGPKGKNNEIKHFKEYLLNNMDKFKDAIVVLDRAYCSYELLKLLNDNKIQFVIRIKNNLLFDKEEKDIKKTNKHYNLIISLKECLRIITIKNNVNTPVTTKNNKKSLINRSITMKLITNLDANAYTNNDIEKIYRDRWDVEVFFKLIKSNCKIDNTSEIKEINQHKLMYCQLIIMKIAKLLENYYILSKNMDKDITINKKNKQTVNGIKKINKSNLLKGIYDNLLIHIVNGNLTEERINKYINAYVIPIINQKNRVFERISLVPFTKWYVVKYITIHQYTKIITAIKEKTVNKLNGNLKLLANQIIKIDNECV